MTRPEWAARAEKLGARPFLEAVVRGYLEVRRPGCSDELVDALEAEVGPCQTPVAPSWDAFLWLVDAQLTLALAAVEAR